MAGLYSLQGDRFASGGAGNMVRVWSTDGYLINKINRHDSWVSSLCWSKDDAYVFSASFDRTIRKWNLKSISGKQLVVLQDQTNTVNSFCLSPDERHLVSASDDFHIWDLETNQLIGQPLLHDDALDCLVVSSDAEYIVSAGRDAKIYVWSLDAVLKQHFVDQAISHSNAESAVKVKRCATQDVRQSVRINKGGMARYRGDFWGDDTNRTQSLGRDITSSSST